MFGIMRRVEALSCAILTQSDGAWKTTRHFRNVEVRDRICNSITSLTKDYMVIEVYEV